MAFLHLHNNELFIFVKDQVCILDKNNDWKVKFSKRLQLPSDIPHTKEETINHYKETPSDIICANISKDGKKMCFATANKVAYVYSKDSNGNFYPYPERPYVFVVKASTSIGFSNSGTHLLISDRHGTVTRYGLTKETIEAERRVKKISVFGEPNELGGEGLVGHVSMIFDFDINEDDSLLFTGDRDEKIKVSHYPDSYNIEHILLGHQGYVSSVVYILNNRLLTGSSDGNLILWNISTGSIISKINVQHGPIRRVKVKHISESEFSVIVTYENIESFSIVNYNSSGEWNVSPLIQGNQKTENDFLFDIVFDGNNFITINKSGFYEIKTSEISCLNDKFVGNEEMKYIIESLIPLTDPLPALSLIKNTDSKNILEYMRRKTIRTLAVKGQ
uniref:WD_REPEATS_REGION domain-containing protein n=1 Tax=Parastrongyloides trichosuri TaxID=131310 RepID=A0A0N4ZX89_PARTI